MTFFLFTSYFQWQSKVGRKTPKKLFTSYFQWQSKEDEGEQNTTGRYQERLVGLTLRMGGGGKKSKYGHSVATFETQQEMKGMHVAPPIQSLSTKFERNRYDVVWVMAPSVLHPRLNDIKHLFDFLHAKFQTNWPIHFSEIAATGHCLRTNGVSYTYL